MQTERIEYRQTALKIRFGVKKIWLGIFFAILSLGLCQIVGGSAVAKIVLPMMFLIVSLVEIDCSDKIAKILVVGWGIISLFVTVFTTQLLLNESTFSLGLQRVLLNMAICGVIMGGLYTLSARIRLSVITGMMVLMSFTAVNYFVYKFRGSELCPADFLSVGTATAVVNRYTFTVDTSFVYAILLTLLFSFVVFCVRGYERNSQSFRNRIASVIGVGVMLLGVMLGSKNVVANHFLQTGSVRNGFLLNFMVEIEENIVKKPEGYNVKAIQSLEEKYDKNIDSVEEVNSPVIIIIMNESFVDLSVLGSEIRTNIEVTPFFDSLSENTIKGHALSSVIGGGTANSEYEFLSGNTMGFLPQGSIVYQQFIQDEPYTLVQYMNQLGYKTVATHPEDEKNWLRYSVYPKMGFEEMHFIDEYPCNEQLREFVSDQEMYNQIIEWFEECSNDRKMFIFGITMQNHGFYDYEGEDFQNTVCLEGYAGSYPDVEQYLTVLHESDIALKNLIDYFESVERDTVILFYGDHFPKLNASFYEEVHGGTFDSLDEQILQYTVPFFVWANYDIEERDVELTSLNYLSNFLLETAGLELPTYNRFLSDVQEVIPAMNSYGYFSNKREEFITYDEATGVELEMLQKYKILQYNCIFDNENISETFFSDFAKDDIK